MNFWQVYGRTELYTKSRWGYLKGSYKLEGIDVHGKKHKMILEKQDAIAWTLFIWLKTGTPGKL
jgi:hypothetical protein